MSNIFREKRVWEGNVWIPLKKFGKGILYTIGLTSLTIIIDAFQRGDIPQEWIVYSGVAIAVLQTIKKAMEKYDPVKDR